MAADRSELGRRQFVSAVGVAAGVAATATATGAGQAIARAVAPEAAPTPADPELSHLFGDLRAGSRLDRWVIVAVHPLRMGAVPVVLETAEGVRFQVDVLRRDGRPGGRAGVASTEGLSVFLSNRGDGARATDEEQGLGAMALAAALGRREAAGAPLPAGLSTHAERRARHPLGSYSVLA